MKKKVAIIKLKSEHDIQWKISRGLSALARNLGSKFEFLRSMDGKSFMPQITPYYLAAIGKEYDEKNGNQYEFKVIDAYPEHIAATDEFDMVWFTTMTTTAPQVYKKADEFRKKGVKVVLGGIHPSMLPKEAKQHADSVAKGEGEMTIPHILKDFADGNLKESYGNNMHERIYVTEGEIYPGRTGPMLYKLPTPLWSSNDGYANWILPVQTSRGCGNACDYCSTTSFQGARRRHRPIEDIINELRFYMDKGMLTEKTAVFFTDNNSVADTNYHKEIFDTRYSKSLFRAIEELRKDVNIKFGWIGQGEINMANDRELLELAAKSGCITQLIGYESLSQENLDSHSKIGNRVERYPEQTEIIHDYGIQIIGCFVMGMPDDKPDVFKKTYNFIKEHIDIPQISLLTPYPGTKTYVKAKRDGLIISEDWSRYDITHLVMKPQCRNKDGSLMSPEELEHRYTKLMKKVYGWREMFKRAKRAAVRPITYNHNPRNSTSRFLSVFAPNMIYRDLALMGRR